MSVWMGLYAVRLTSLGSTGVMAGKALDHTHLKINEATLAVA